MKKKLAIVLLCMVLIFFVGGCSSSAPASSQPAAGNDAKPITIKVACDNTTGGPWDLGFKKFMEIAKAKAGNKIEFQYYPDGQLSNNDQRTTIEMLQTGSVHIAAILPAIYEQFDPRWQIYSMPYLFKTQDEARASCDGAAGQYMLKLLQEKQIQGLALWEQGFRHLTTSKKEVHVPADLKGMKIRVMDSPTFISMFNGLGTLPTVTSMGELFTALQQGAVDGQENPLTTIARRKFNEVQKYLIMTGHVYSPLILGMNKAFYDKIPADIQKILTDAAVEARKTERDAVAKEDETWKQELKKTMTVIELNDQELNAWKEATKPVYAEFEPKIGKEIVDMFIKK